MTDIRQSPQFAAFMRDLNWQVAKIGSAYIYLKKFPLFGHFAKIPRPDKNFSLNQIKYLYKQYIIFRLKIAPYLLVQDKNAELYRRKLLSSGFKIEHSPFNPTTTIRIDLTQKEETIFNSFTEAKRRGVRRAVKNGITVKESNDLEAFIKVRKQQYKLIGFLITKEMKMLWKNFHPRHAALLLAYPTMKSQPLTRMQTIASINNEKPLAGILLLMYDKVAYYWYASALKEGKKLFAPTLLVWEALRTAKRKSCRIFDFEGICDDRFPKASLTWKGFTKFKEGFGGKKIIFLENFLK